MKITRAPLYAKAISRLMDEADAQLAEELIARTWQQQPVIKGSGGMRKARIALDGRGKRGGARVIFVVRVQADNLILLDAYAKNDQSDVSPETLHRLKKILDQMT